MLLHDDFEVWYGFREATVPPPDHFEFEIHLGPDEGGEILYRPDYPSDETPRWDCRFHWPEERRAELHRLMVERNVFDSRSHPPQDMEAAGGRSESLEVHSDGRSFELPWGPPGRLAPDVVQALRGCVPDYIWDQLADRQEAYGRS